VNERQEILEKNGFPAKNNNRDPTIREVLLILKTAVYREENIKVCCLRCFEEFAIL